MCTNVGRVIYMLVDQFNRRVVQHKESLLCGRRVMVVACTGLPDRLDPLIVQDLVNPLCVLMLVELFTCRFFWFARHIIPVYTKYECFISHTRVRARWPQQPNFFMPNYCNGCPYLLVAIKIATFFILKPIKNCHHYTMTKDKAII